MLCVCESVCFRLCVCVCARLSVYPAYSQPSPHFPLVAESRNRTHNKEFIYYRSVLPFKSIGGSEM